MPISSPALCRLLFGSILAAWAGSRPALASERPPQEMLQQWLGRLTGAPVDNLPVEITPDGERYLLTIPLRDAVSPPKGNGQPVSVARITAALRPDGPDVWRMDGLRFPEHFSASVMVPTPDGGPPVLAAVLIDVGSHHGSGRLDTSLRTASTLDVEARDARMEQRAAAQHVISKFDVLTLSASLSPAESGQVDLAEASAAEGLSTQINAPDQPLTSFAARRINVAAKFQGIDPARAGAAITSLTQFNSGLTAGEATSAALAGKLTPDQRRRLHGVIETFVGLAEAGHVDESFEDMRVRSGDSDVTIGRAAIGVDADARKDVFSASAHLDISGLVPAGLPADARAMVPTRVSLRPSISGLAAKPLVRALLAAFDDPDAGNAPPDLSALLADGPVSVSVNDVAIDVGGAELRGAATLVAQSPDTGEAHARIEATGLDALIRQWQSIPQLQVAIPALLLAKGLARTEGGKLIWDIQAGQSGVTVNRVNPLGGLLALPKPSSPAKPPANR